MIVPGRFMKFLEDIVQDGDWEYGDGSPMTEDAKATLAEIQRLYDVIYDLTVDQDMGRWGERQ